MTHDQVEAMTLAQPMFVINQGLPEQIGTPMEVFDRPVSTFVASFIGSLPMNRAEVSVDPNGLIKTLDGIDIQLASDRVPQQMRSKQVVVSIRPEHMVLNGRGLSAEVEIVETLGSEKLVHLYSGKTQLVVGGNH